MLTYASAGNVSGTVGSAYAEIGTLWTAAQQGSGAPRILELATARPALYWRPTKEICIFDGVTESAGAAFTEGSTPQKVASNWGGSTMFTASAGTVSGSTAFDGDMNVGASITLGLNGSGTENWYGNIRNLRLWSRALSSSELASMTA